jgi:dipeptidyl aminopeptidase/acylaminoacyl peptidase
MARVVPWKLYRIAGLATCVVGLLVISHLRDIRPVEANKRAFSSEATRRPLTVADAIEATRALHTYGSDPVLISPDGKKYLIILQRGDLARNGSWVELLSGSTASIEAASHPIVVARLFSTSTAQTNELIKYVRWLGDNERVAFLWDSGQGPPQVVEVDVKTHAVRNLTHHSTRIQEYDISRDGLTLIFTAQRPRDRSKLSAMGQTGFAVTDQSIWSLLDGNLDGWEYWRHNDAFISSQSQPLPRKLQEPDRIWSFLPELLQLSPNGHYAIAVRPVGEVPTDWDKYTQHMFKDVYLPVARQHSGGPNWVRRYVIIDIKKGTSRPLWNAPEDPHGAVIWSSDSRSLLVGPTFLPPAQADAAGLSGRAVAEVDVVTGHYVQVPLPENLSPYAYRPSSWKESGVIEFADKGIYDQHDVRLKFKKTDGRWEPIEEETRAEPSSPPVRIELREDPNTPPALYAIETSSGRDRLILDLNPQLRKKVKLGRVEIVHWDAKDGRHWTGMLYYPVDYEASRRFPLVIQTHGYSTKDFSLDGVFTTAFAAQPLANRDIAVLQIGGSDSGDRDVSMTPQETAVYMAGVEGAIEKFAADGLVDREKVGIIGFSWTVFDVEYTLTHSKYPFAAAEVADGIDGGYFQYALADPAAKASSEAMKGTAPIGEGLPTWMREAPGFNADKVRTPLRMEIDSGPMSEILTHWEMFSSLRYQHKPVELFVIPNILHGAHELQNPAQRLASQGGTVDWFCFWLQGEEDHDPAKANQYGRWHDLRALQDDNPKMH